MRGKKEGMKKKRKEIKERRGKERTEGKKGREMVVTYAAGDQCILVEEVVGSGRYGKRGWGITRAHHTVDQCILVEEVVGSGKYDNRGWGITRAHHLLCLGKIKV